MPENWARAGLVLTLLVGLAGTALGQSAALQTRVTGSSKDFAEVFDPNLGRWVARQYVPIQGRASSPYLAAFAARDLAVVYDLIPDPTGLRWRTHHAGGYYIKHVGAAGRLALFVAGPIGLVYDASVRTLDKFVMTHDQAFLDIEARIITPQVAAVVTNARVRVYDPAIGRWLISNALGTPYIALAATERTLTGTGGGRSVVYAIGTGRFSYR